jgi:hypothetical protein
VAVGHRDDCDPAGPALESMAGDRSARCVWARSDHAQSSPGAGGAEVVIGHMDDRNPTGLGVGVHGGWLICRRVWARSACAWSSLEPVELARSSGACPRHLSSRVAEPVRLAEPFCSALLC